MKFLKTSVLGGVCGAHAPQTPPSFHFLVENIFHMLSPYLFLKKSFYGYINRKNLVNYRIMVDLSSCYTPQVNEGFYLENKNTMGLEIPIIKEKNLPPSPQ